jgi:1-pyrroline-5-carboxylate dehydrogenase
LSIFYLIENIYGSRSSGRSNKFRSWFRYTNWKYCSKKQTFNRYSFYGSNNTFNTLWKGVTENLSNYISYPKLVGETGGKDFIFVHNSANPIEVATAIIRGAFEYQGQKCSAASRSYIPKSLWNEN